MRSRGSTTSLGLLAGLVAVVGCSACSRDVGVPPPEPPPTGDAAAACSSLAQRLPGELYGQQARTTVPEGGTTAAWGDPPIVLRCGVARPEGLTPTSTLVEVDGVSWFAEELSAGYRFTATGRAANVEVTVPDAYRPEVNPLVGLGPAIASTVPPAGSTG